MQNNYYSRNPLQDFNDIQENFASWASERNLQCKVLRSMEKASEIDENSTIGLQGDAEAKLAVFDGFFLGLKLTFQSSGDLEILRYSRFERLYEKLAILSGFAMTGYGLYGSAQRVLTVGLPGDNIGTAIAGLFFMVLLAPVVGVITAIGVFLVGAILESPFILLFGKAYKEIALEKIWLEVKPKILIDENKATLIEVTLQHGEKLYSQMYNDPQQWSDCAMAMVRARDLATEYGWTDWAEKINERFIKMKYVHDQQLRSFG